MGAVSVSWTVDLARYATGPAAVRTRHVSTCYRFPHAWVDTCPLASDFCIHMSTRVQSNVGLPQVVELAVTASASKGLGSEAGAPPLARRLSVMMHVGEWGCAPADTTPKVNLCS